MTGNELYEEYCNEYPLIMGYREVSYESWLQRQVLELRENVVNKNPNNPQSKPDGYTLLAAGVASRWKRYRDVLYKLYDFTNDVEGYKRSMREYQLIIKAWMQKHKQEIVAEAVAEICKQEDDPRIKIKFMSAGYDLASGQDYALLCSCEMPAKVKGKNECWRCKRPLKEFLRTER